ncbi:MAG TPA: protein translocase subunit SecD, partial [Gammaproteobacteria bacterium]|nr:protein translocase subunit SecD [Gammaproteobacteria bacterium]
MNQYPAWKYILLIVLVAAGFLLALPNIYGEDPAVQVSKSNSAPLTADVSGKIKDALAKNKLQYKSIKQTDQSVLVRFDDTDTQLKAEADLQQALGSSFVVAVNLAPRTPAWLRAMGLKPMSRGLDLRGGVHFLLQVDIKAAVDQALSRNRKDIQDLLDKKLGPGNSSVQRNGEEIDIRFHSEANRDRAQGLISDLIGSTNISLVKTDINGDPALIARVPEQAARTLQSNAVEQNITTLRNRVNELGVSEPIIQRQGRDQIAVELPGVQDTARAKEILGATATLEFRLVDTSDNAIEAARTGHVPLDAKLYRNTPRGQPVLLKRDVIASGAQLVDAQPGFDSQTGGPVVNVTLDSTAASRMLDTTRNNLNKPMAV